MTDLFVDHLLSKRLEFLWNQGLPENVVDSSFYALSNLISDNQHCNNTILSTAQKYGIWS